MNSKLIKNINSNFLHLFYNTEEKRLSIAPDPCNREPETGPCRARIPRYYFDKDDRICKRFTYGGCKGNKNNFQTKGECYEICGDCLSEPDTGPCKASIARYYFDQNDKTCKKFRYGGCDGNKNNFLTERDCLMACNRRPMLTTTTMPKTTTLVVSESNYSDLHSFQIFFKFFPCFHTSLELKIEHRSLKNV